MLWKLVIELKMHSQYTNFLSAALVSTAAVTLLWFHWPASAAAPSTDVIHWHLPDVRLHLPVDFLPLNIFHLLISNNITLLQLQKMKDTHYVTPGDYLMLTRASTGGLKVIMLTDSNDDFLTDIC